METSILNTKKIWIKPAIAGAFAALALMACVPAVTALKPVEGLDVKTLNVRNISVKIAAPSAPPGLATLLKTTLASNFDDCTRGSQDVDLDVRIDNFKEANPVAVMLVGDVTNMAGSVSLVNLPAGLKKAEFYIEVGAGGGGLIGIAVTANPGKDLSQKFAHRICEEIFLSPPVKAESAFKKDWE